MLRVSGKRTLSKMNAFDFIVTVALGSTLASIILTESVALIEGLLGLAMLIFLQFAITWLSVRSETISGLVKAEPALLYHKDHYIRSQMKRSRVTESEVQAAVREHGEGAMEQIVSVVLETDGSFSVMSSSSHDQAIPLGVDHPSTHA